MTALIGLTTAMSIGLLGDRLRHCAVASVLQSSRGVISMCELPYSPLEMDAMTLLFPSPLLRVDLRSVMPAGTLDALAEDVMRSWQAHRDEQALIASHEQALRSDDQDELPIRARSAQELNEEFFYFQKRRYGVTGHASSPAADGWMATDAAQELLGAVSAAAGGYLERVAHHAGLDVDRPDASADDWGVDPDRWHMWASVHSGGSTHPAHVHMGAVVSCVCYVRMPAGGGQICFFDPRGRIPPFERQVRHSPVAGEVLLFPPWLSHAVAGGANDDEVRISVSFNLLDEDLEGGRYGWGAATAALEVVTLEDDLGLAQRDDDGEEEQGHSESIEH